MPVAKKRTHRTNLQGIPEFMLRLARQQQVKIFETLALPKYRHD